MSGPLLALSLLLLQVSASPSFQPRGKVDGSHVDAVEYVDNVHPCIKLQQLREMSVAAGNDPPSVPADAAMECLDTVPIHLDAAQTFLDRLPNYLSFHSTLSYISTPPAGSSFKSVDLLSGLTLLGNDVRNGKFTSQLRFEDAVTRLFLSCHDENMSVEFGASSVVKFAAPFGLATFSKDGNAPKVYIDDELYNEPTTSPILKIDGQDVAEYLQKLSDDDPAICPDARYNNLFSTNSRSVRHTDNEGTFRNRIVYPGGDSFNVTFENGTTNSYAYSALLMKDISGIDSGEAFFSTFALPGDDKDWGWEDTGMDSGMVEEDVMDDYSWVGGANNTQAEDDFVPPITASGDGGDPFPDGGVFQTYPYANLVVKDPGNHIAGFKVENAYGLVITSFDAEDDTGIAKSFQATIQQFLDAARNGNITQKLVIDVRGSGGDATFLAYDTAQQLFPQLQLYTGQRMRYTSTLSTLISSYSTSSTPIPPSSDLDSSSPDYRHTFLSTLTHSLNSTLNPFTSFPQDMLGPIKANNDEFTHVFRTDLSDPLSYGSFMTISGHGNLNRETQAAPVFYPENVILVTDGSCSSACAVFAEILTHQLGIRSVVVGGRSSVKGVVNAIGGCKGVLRVSSRELLYASNTYGSSNRDILPQPLPIRAKVHVNLIDNIRAGDEAGVPLQYTPTLADCRLFETEDSYMNPDKIWRDVADIAWNPDTNKKCVYGSLNVKGGCSCGNKGNPVPSGTGFAGATVTETMTVPVPTETDSYRVSPIPVGSSASSSRVVGRYGVLCAALVAFLMV